MRSNGNDRRQSWTVRDICGWLGTGLLEMRWLGAVGVFEDCLGMGRLRMVAGGWELES